jgi:hypothetical protein|tara:strand:- start:272 stop:706 length:435 start_codon:yes stop_codon:yes gene_type:complete
MRSDILNVNSQNTGSAKQKVVNLTVAATLTEADSGKVFMLDSAGGAYSITLPTGSSIEDGILYKFYVSEETPTGAITIAAGSAIVSFVQKDAGGDASNSTAGTQISNIVIGTSAQKSDYIELMAAGGEWVGFILSGINNAITTS